MSFTGNLLSWYSDNKRDLPWRGTKDPYLIWLSEIILQQTRVEQGKPYYEKFVTAYPTVKHLAAADEQNVLKLWQGLGYYSRARNLLSTARVIMNVHHGIFPGTFAGLLDLKGIGDYTAAAIASICFDLPHPVVDGNVLRFFSRLHGITDSIDHPGTKKKINGLLQEKIDHQNPGDFNQAMMEIGATVCMPVNPKCSPCVFKESCISFNNKITDKIPVRNSKAKIRHRYIHYFVMTISDQGKEFICLNKRTGNDIWRNLYDFPSLERPLNKNEHQVPEHEFLALVNPIAPIFQDVSLPFVHLLTHQKIHARFYRFHCDKTTELPYTLVPLEEIAAYPVPKLIDRYLSRTILKTTF